MASAAESNAITSEMQIQYVCTGYSGKENMPRMHTFRRARLPTCTPWHPRYWLVSSSWHTAASGCIQLCTSGWPQNTVAQAVLAAFVANWLTISTSSLYFKFMYMHAHILPLRFTLSHCGHGHELTSVVQLTVIKIVGITSTSAFVGNTGIKVLLPKRHWGCPIAEKPTEGGLLC